MPRASTYRSAAASLRRTSNHLAELAVRHQTFGPEQIRATGPVGELHGDAIDEVRRHLSASADELMHLAGECERRALVCDDFERRMRHHRSLPPLQRLVTPAPVPPASWVET